MPTELTAKQEGTLRLLNMNVTPFKEVREALLQQGRSLESVQDVRINIETQQVESQDGEWENHEATGETTVRVVFDQLIFKINKDGIRLAE